MRRVVGLDGCPGGWVGVVLGGARTEVVTAGSVRELLLDADVAVVGVDIPIGLPDHGRREADRLARARLPPGRTSSVFPTPSRAACEASGWAEANAVNRAATGAGLSHQGWNLVARIVEVDQWVRSGRAPRVVEVHPEVSLAAIDPLCVVASKKTSRGRADRARALASAGVESPAYEPGRGYAADDLLDACAVAWTAERVVAGTALCLPDPPEVFADGLPAAIWV